MPALSLHFMNIVTLLKIDRICTIPFFLLLLLQIFHSNVTNLRGGSIFFLPLSEPVTISKGAGLSMHSEKAAWLNFNGLCLGEGENEKTKPGYLHTYFNFSNVMQMQHYFQHVKTKQKVKSVQSISMIRWKLTSIDMPEKKSTLIYPYSISTTH